MSNKNEPIFAWCSVWHYTKLVSWRTNYRILYRDTLPIATLGLASPAHPCLWLITWDPTQPIATRPPSIQKDSTWYCYGWDLTKNICEIYSSGGYIRTVYTYTPYGEVTSSGSVDQSPRGLGGGLDKPKGFAPQGRGRNGVRPSQPIQWSSEYADTELGLVYYNYRYYNPTDGRWLSRDEAKEQDFPNLSLFVHNSPIQNWDMLGLFAFCKPKCGSVGFDTKVYCCRENQLILKSSLPKCRNCRLENEQCLNLVRAEYNRNNQALEKTLNMELTENSTKMNDMLKDCENSFGFGSILHSLCVAGVKAAPDMQNGIIWATYQAMASLLCSTFNNEYSKCELAMKDCSPGVILAIKNGEYSAK